MPDETNVPSAEDEAREAAEAEEMRKKTIEKEKVEDLQFLHHQKWKMKIQI